MKRPFSDHFSSRTIQENENEQNKNFKIFVIELSSLRHMKRDLGEKGATGGLTSLVPPCF